MADLRGTVAATTLVGDTNYEKAKSALDEAWAVITDPPGQAQHTEENRLPWAAVAIRAGVGHALLALCDELAAQRRE